MIKTILIDCDGVLTDGKIYMDHSGKKMFKAFHSRDVRALRELTANGFEVVIVTADKSDISKRFAEKTGVQIVVERDKQKIADDYSNYAAVGDDAWDVPMLKNARRAFCPEDADASVLQMGNVEKLAVKGGLGVIAYLVPMLLRV